ncbi:MAG: PD-(D/E)XK nuclease family transposase [Candidatus Ornithomonoglobus sp.]
MDSTEEKLQHEKDLEYIRNFRLIDDDFMSVVFSDIECAELLLQIIMDKDDLRVIKVNTQKAFKNLHGHSITIDIFAEDSVNTKYDVEVQRADSGAVPKRARYNSSIIDANVLEPGDDYENLSDVYVIFITENDIIGDNKPIYHIQRTIEESGRAFDDGSHIIYVNGEIKNETKLGRLMHDFYCTKPDAMEYKVLADKVRYFKENENGVINMCKAMEEMRNEAARKANLATAQKLITLGKLTYEEIALASNLTVEEVKALDSRKTA